MVASVTPEHSTLDRLFARGCTYCIPASQRPYSWQSVGRSAQDSQVIHLWEDLWSFFKDNRDNSREYFLGCMIMVEDSSRLRMFEVVDGHQRLTTLVLLFAAMRFFLREVEETRVSSTGQPSLPWFSKVIQTLESLIYNETRFGLAPTLKLKIDRNLGADFDRVLEVAIAFQGDSQLESLDKRGREIAQRYFENRDYFLSRLRAEFFATGSVDMEEIRRFDDFFKFLQARIALVLLKSPDLATAYRIFATLNDRGLPREQDPEQ